MAIRQLTLSSTCRLSYVQKNTRKSQSQFFLNFSLSISNSERDTERGTFSGAGAGKFKFCSNSKREYQQITKTSSNRQPFLPYITFLCTHADNLKQDSGKKFHQKKSEKFDLFLKKLGSA
jgi:hypothetical protein